MDVGVLAVAGPGRAADTARRLEALGLHTVLFPDSQNLAPEVWGQLMLAAKATERIRLGPGVSNSITRDAAVTASAALALQVESGGRAVLGIGRGDSSVQRIGRREDPVASFERYLTAVQAYLAGEAVDRDGFASRLEWYEHAKVAKVPVDADAVAPVAEIYRLAGDQQPAKARKRPCISELPCLSATSAAMARSCANSLSSPRPKVTTV